MVIALDMDKNGKLHFRDYKTGRWASKAAYEKQYPKLKKPSVRAKEYRERKKKERERAKIVVPLLWRLTMAVNKLTRKGEIGILVVVHKYYSVTVTYWATNKEDAESQEEEAKTRVWDLAAKVCKHDQWEDWNVYEPNYSLQGFPVGEAHTKRALIGEFEDHVVDVT